MRPNAPYKHCRFWHYIDCLCVCLPYYLLPYSLAYIFFFLRIRPLFSRLDVIRGEYTWVIICFSLFYVVWFLLILKNPRIFCISRFMLVLTL